MAGEARIITRTEIGIARVFSPRPLWGLNALAKTTARMMAPKLASNSLAKTFPAALDSLGLNHQCALQVLKRREFLDPDGKVPAPILRQSFEARPRLENGFAQWVHDSTLDAGLNPEQVARLGQAFFDALTMTVDLTLDFVGRSAGPEIGFTVRDELLKRNVYQLIVKAGPNLPPSSVEASLKYSLSYLASKGMPDNKTIVFSLPGIKDPKPTDLFGSACGAALAISHSRLPSSRPHHLKMVIYRTS